MKFQNKFINIYFHQWSPAASLQLGAGDGCGGRSVRAGTHPPGSLRHPASLETEMILSITSASFKEIKTNGKY